MNDIYEEKVTSPQNEEKMKRILPATVVSDVT